MRRLQKYRSIGHVKISSYISCAAKKRIALIIENCLFMICDFSEMICLRANISLTGVFIPLIFPLLLRLPMSPSVTEGLREWQGGMHVAASRGNLLYLTISTDSGDNGCLLEAKHIYYPIL